jgi:hypothetical protein
MFKKLFLLFLLFSNSLPLFAQQPTPEMVAAEKSLILNEIKTFASVNQSFIAANYKDGIKDEDVSFTKPIKVYVIYRSDFKRYKKEGFKHNSIVKQSGDVFVWQIAVNVKGEPMFVAEMDTIKGQWSIPVFQFNIDQAFALQKIIAKYPGDKVDICISPGLYDYFISLKDHKKANLSVVKVRGLWQLNKTKGIETVNDEIGKVSDAPMSVQIILDKCDTLEKAWTTGRGK